MLNLALHIAKSIMHEQTTNKQSEPTNQNQNNSTHPMREKKTITLPTSTVLAGCASYCVNTEHIKIPSNWFKSLVTNMSRVGAWVP